MNSHAMYNHAEKLNLIDLNASLLSVDEETINKKLLSLFETELEDLVLNIAILNKEKFFTLYLDIISKIIIDACGESKFQLIENNLKDIKTKFTEMYYNPIIKDINDYITNIDSTQFGNSIFSSQLNANISKHSRASKDSKVQDHDTIINLKKVYTKTSNSNLNLNYHDIANTNNQPNFSKSSEKDFQSINIINSSVKNSTNTMKKNNTNIFKFNNNLYNKYSDTEAFDLHSNKTERTDKGLRTTKSVNKSNDIYTSKETNSNFFYIKHCNNYSLNDYINTNCKETTMTHTCGTIMIIIRNNYLKLKNHTSLHCNSDYLYCTACKLVYFTSCFNLKCDKCEKQYYSSYNKPLTKFITKNFAVFEKLLSNNSGNYDILNNTKHLKQIMLPVTWEKYHCKVYFNDPIKCTQCKNDFYINFVYFIQHFFNYDRNSRSNKELLITCITCNYELDPQSILFSCYICKENFTTNIKLYNSFELRSYKITIKEALLFKKELALPQKLPCCGLEKEKNFSNSVVYYKTKTNERVSNLVFYHNKTCKGKLYIGKIRNEIGSFNVYICSECKIISDISLFIWTCPCCLKKFRIKTDNTKINKKNNYKIKETSKNSDSNSISRENNNSSHAINNKEVNQRSMNKHHTINMDNDSKDKYRNAFIYSQDINLKSNKHLKSNTNIGVEYNKRINPNSNMYDSKVHSNKTLLNLSNINKNDLSMSKNCATDRSNAFSPRGNDNINNNVSNNNNTRIRNYAKSIDNIKQGVIRTLLPITIQGESNEENVNLNIYSTKDKNKPILKGLNNIHKHTNTSNDVYCHTTRETNKSKLTNTDNLSNISAMHKNDSFNYNANNTHYNLDDNTRKASSQDFKYKNINNFQKVIRSVIKTHSKDKGHKESIDRNSKDYYNYNNINNKNKNEINNTVNTVNTINTINTENTYYDDQGTFGPTNNNLPYNLPFNNKTNQTKIKEMSIGDNTKINNNCNINNNKERTLARYNTISEHIKSIEIETNNPEIIREDSNNLKNKSILKKNNCFNTSIYDVPEKELLSAAKSAYTKKNTNKRNSKNPNNSSYSIINNKSITIQDDLYDYNNQNKINAVPICHTTKASLSKEINYSKKFTFNSERKAGEFDIPVDDERYYYNDKGIAEFPVNESTINDVSNVHDYSSININLNNKSFNKVNTHKHFFSHSILNKTFNNENKNVNNDLNNSNELYNKNFKSKLGNNNIINSSSSNIYDSKFKVINNDINKENDNNNENNNVISKPSINSSNINVKRGFYTKDFKISASNNKKERSKLKNPFKIYVSSNKKKLCKNNLKKESDRKDNIVNSDIHSKVINENQEQLSLLQNNKNFGSYSKSNNNNNNNSVISINVFKNKIFLGNNNNDSQVNNLNITNVSVNNSNANESKQNNPNTNNNNKQITGNSIFRYQKKTKSDIPKFQNLGNKQDINNNISNEDLDETNNKNQGYTANSIYNLNNNTNNKTHYKNNNSKTIFSIKNDSNYNINNNNNNINNMNINHLNINKQLFSKNNNKANNNNFNTLNTSNNDTSGFNYHSVINNTTFNQENNEESNVFSSDIFSPINKKHINYNNYCNYNSNLMSNKNNIKTSFSIIDSSITNNSNYDNLNLNKLKFNNLKRKEPNDNYNTIGVDTSIKNNHNINMNSSFNQIYRKGVINSSTINYDISTHNNNNEEQQPLTARNSNSYLYKSNFEDLNYINTNNNNTKIRLNKKGKSIADENSLNSSCVYNVDDNNNNNYENSAYLADSNKEKEFDNKYNPMKDENTPSKRKVSFFKPEKEVSTNQESNEQENNINNYKKIFDNNAATAYRKVSSTSNLTSLNLNVIDNNDDNVDNNADNEDIDYNSRLTFNNNFKSNDYNKDINITKFDSPQNKKGNTFEIYQMFLNLSSKKKLRKSEDAGKASSTKLNNIKSNDIDDLDLDKINSNKRFSCKTDREVNNETTNNNYNTEKNLNSTVDCIDAHINNSKNNILKESNNIPTYTKQPINKNKRININNKLDTTDKPNYKKQGNKLNIDIPDNNTPQKQDNNLGNNNNMESPSVSNIANTSQTHPFNDSENNTLNAENIQYFNHKSNKHANNIIASSKINSNSINNSNNGSIQFNNSINNISSGNNTYFTGNTGSTGKNIKNSNQKNLNIYSTMNNTNHTSHKNKVINIPKPMNSNINNFIKSSSSKINNNCHKINSSVNKISPVTNNKEEEIIPVKINSFKDNTKIVITSSSSLIKDINNNENSNDHKIINVNNENNDSSNLSNKSSSFNSSSKTKTLPFNHFNMKEFKLLDKIGEGTYGTIYKVIHKASKQFFAMKKIIVNDENDIKAIKEEYTLMQGLEHKNILSIYGISIQELKSNNSYQDNDNYTTLKYEDKVNSDDEQLPKSFALFVLMELADTDLNKEIQSRIKSKTHFTQEELIELFSQIITALFYLQQKRIAHRDVKPHNILVFHNYKNDNDENKVTDCLSPNSSYSTSKTRYKISDFSEAKQFLDNQFIISENNTKRYNESTLRGTELYMSPALFKGLSNQSLVINHNPIKSDVYSFCLCFLYCVFLDVNILYYIRKSESYSKVTAKIIEMFVKDKRFNKKSNTINSLSISINSSFVRGMLGQSRILYNEYDWLLDLLVKMIDKNEEKRPDFIDIRKTIDENNIQIDM